MKTSTSKRTLKYYLCCIPSLTLICGMCIVSFMAITEMFSSNEHLKLFIGIILGSISGCYLWYKEPNMYSDINFLDIVSIKPKNSSPKLEQLKLQPEQLTLPL